METEELLEKESKVLQELIKLDQLQLEVFHTMISELRLNPKIDIEQAMVNAMCSWDL